MPTLWREQAELLDQYGASDLAKTCRLHADELEQSLTARADEQLTLSQAADESGYSSDRLRHMLSEGLIPNVGRKHAPRILRRDLPRKPRRSR